MMVGFHQNFVRANQHREHHKEPLPHGIKPIPHLMAEAGYFTAIMSRKTDCNFTPIRGMNFFRGPTGTSGRRAYRKNRMYPPANI